MAHIDPVSIVKPHDELKQLIKLTFDTDYSYIPLAALTMLTKMEDHYPKKLVRTRRLPTKRKSGQLLTSSEATDHELQETRGARPMFKVPDIHSQAGYVKLSNVVNKNHILGKD